MTPSNLYQVKVLSGRRMGASHALPLGDLSIGTTLEAEFFIGCVDMWHQLLRADSSANSRSATASGDVLPEKLMHSTVNHSPSGIQLTVHTGFAEISGKRLLPGDSGTVPLDTELRIGASRLEIQSVVGRGELASKGPMLTDAKHHWLNSKVAFMGITAFAVAGLVGALVLNPPASDASKFLPTESAKATLFSERVVAIVSTSPAFAMTESGRRYEVGAQVDDGYEIVSISGSNIELQRGTERLKLSF